MIKFILEECFMVCGWCICEKKNEKFKWVKKKSETKSKDWHLKRKGKKIENEIFIYFIVVEMKKNGIIIENSWS